ncbi:tRNA(fMet)-specific endonuclease VapC [Singulisphaera sp. GP187]|uniref:PIN domain-containing protein n=1 Tax=Singulisphaera sp. GP187 TaxID=1882752 RepID=UPI00092C7006|nr:PIN domain-containing protein [Singulisphaera sp. GP187]SIO66620.1 tRNA(fMet)-specific endonuclease VapC [Singulisphaera sp. GP187]
MNKALIDTDIFSELGKGIDPAVIGNGRTYRRSFGHYSISSITVMEIVRGFQRTLSTRRLQTFLASIAAQEILPFDQPAAELAGRIAGDLERAGQSIGTADPMIAAIALNRGLELVTGNTAHFQRIQQLGYPLTLINWR